METIVSISNEEIKAVVGKRSANQVTVRQVISVPLAENAMINGVIINEAEVRKGLQQLQSQLKKPAKKIRLIVDSNTLMIRKMTVPVLKEDKLKAYLHEEFLMMEKEKELLVDYTVLQPSMKESGAEVLGVAMERSFLDSYLKLFGELSIKISSIEPAIGPIVRLIRHGQLFAQDTSAVVVFNGASVTMYLIAKGQYMFMNRSRLFQERGSAEGATEIIQLISSLTQFLSTDKSVAALSHVYLSNMIDAERTNMQGALSLTDNLTKALNIPAEELTTCKDLLSSQSLTQFSFADYLYPVAALLED